MGGRVARCRHVLWLLPLLLGAAAAAQDATLTADAPAQPAAPSLEGCVEASGAGPRPLAIGACLRSALDERDPALPADPDLRYEDYLLALPAGDAVQIDMDAVPPATATTPEQAEVNELDTALEILNESGERLAFNDDRRDSLNSTLVFVAPDDQPDGRYIVRARTFAGGEGDYVLRTRAIPAPPPPAMLTGAVAGILTPADVERERLVPSFGGVRYLLLGRRGERVRLGLRSRIRDAVLWVHGPGVARPISVRDADGNLDAVFQLPRDGRYLVRVTAAQLSGPQEFALDLARGEPPAAPSAPLPLVRGQPAGGALTLGSDAGLLLADRISYFFQPYSLAVEAGDVLVVTMQSPDFRPLVDVGTMSPLGYANVPAMGTNASPLIRRLPPFGGNAIRLELRPERAGTLILRARSIQAGTGAFTLTVGNRETAPASPPEPPSEPAPEPAP